MKQIEKGNAGEKFVNEIAFNSFMNFWCYPSPKDEKGDKKEICDLLIIFADHTIIISVKNYEFKDNYARYFKKTIHKAVNQIYGAERKLFKLDRDIFIKHPEREIKKFPKEQANKVHRVIVNLGEGVRFYPFQKETKDDKFITLFDKEAFKTIVEELDTIPDFVEYLTKREELFSNKNVIILPGEEEDFPRETAFQFFKHAGENFDPTEKTNIVLSGTEHDLLAHYLKNERNFPEVFHSDEYNGLFIQLDGFWEEFIAKKQVKKKKELDKNSYFIDELVKREVLINNNPKSIELAKELLTFDRFSRRIIADNFFDFYSSYKDNMGMNLARRYGDMNGKGIVFAFFTPSMEDKMVNVLLEITLDSFCVFTNYKSSSIILIATTKDFKQFKIGLLKDIKPFPKEKELQVREEVKKLGWFTNHQEFQVTNYEYPNEE